MKNRKIKKIAKQMKRMCREIEHDCLVHDIEMASDIALNCSEYSCNKMTTKHWFDVLNKLDKREQKLINLIVDDMQIRLI